MLVSLATLTSVLALSLIICPCGQQREGGCAASGLDANQAASREEQEQLRSQSQSQKRPQRGRGAIYLESMEDLEHLTYLSIRNFNITDEGLLEASWFSGLGNALAHKQHGKAAPLSVTDLRGRLSLMLESFISHLRNGHLRRLKLDELEALASALNLTKPLVDVHSNSSRLQQESPGDKLEAGGAAESLRSGGAMSASSGSAARSSPSTDAGGENSSERCHYLVMIYKYELKEREKNLKRRQQEQERQLQKHHSSIEYESSQADTRTTEPTMPERDESHLELGGQSSDADFDYSRMVQLCKLAVNCHSAEELVDLINGPWRPPAKGQVGRERRSLPGKAFGLNESGISGFGGGGADDDGARETFAGEQVRARSSLRNSLSLSLAKLCPLILFQLHDDDGLCTFRRDDRPPMVTVWAFATLFVTIVSFCSLIGLSITPLLGASATASNLDSDACDGSALPVAAGWRLGQRVGANSNSNSNNQPQHRTCLTLFEGLAVGSLVGSALFSLIPQAFELQERALNQGFLLKALIIFFGIYLFFLSERLMRIILDTRQQRKKRRRFNNRSSNSIPPTNADFDHQHQHHQQQQQPSVHLDWRQARSHQRAPASYQVDLNGRKNLANPQSFASCSSTPAPPTPLRSSGKTDKRESGGAGPSGRLFGGGSACVKQSRHQKKRSQAKDQHIEIHSMGAIGSEPVIPIKSVKFPQRQRKQPVVADESLAKLNWARQKAAQLAAATPTAATSDKSGLASGDKTAAKARKRKTRRQLFATKRQRRRQPLQCRPLRANTNESDDFYLKTRHLSSPSASSSSLSGRSNLNLNSNGRAKEDSLAGESNAYMSGSNSGSSSDDCGSDFSEADGLQQMRAVNQQLSKYSQRRLEAANINKATQPRASLQFSDTADQFAGCRRLVSSNQKQDISTVAWMIILGDGLHNFIDGISIGAAFSESILSGVSISVAVICEEFPHELGDFAVLVSSGMTVRQALGYNFLSACTCYFGMAVGIILGDVNDGASYISALAAGVFLYIALVDMMGELSASLEESSRDSITKTLKLLLLQNIGIFIGISIIFVLSFIDF